MRMSQFLQARLKTYWALSACFVAALYRGSAKQLTNAPKSVTIIQLAKLGDMVCTTPMFAAIKKAYPQTEVFVVGNNINQALLAGHPQVDEYVVWNDNVQDMAQKNTLAFV